MKKLKNSWSVKHWNNSEAVFKTGFLKKRNKMEPFFMLITNQQNILQPSWLLKRMHHYFLVTEWTPWKNKKRALKSLSAATVRCKTSFAIHQLPGLRWQRFGSLIGWLLWRHSWLHQCLCVQPYLCFSFKRTDRCIERRQSTPSPLRINSQLKYINGALCRF